jgi:hypothetical protein
VFFSWQAFQAYCNEHSSLLGPKLQKKKNIVHFDKCCRPELCSRVGMILVELRKRLGFKHLESWPFFWIYKIEKKLWKTDIFLLPHVAGSIRLFASVIHTKLL